MNTINTGGWDFPTLAFVWDYRTGAIMAGADRLDAPAPVAPGPAVLGVSEPRLQRRLPRLALDVALAPGGQPRTIVVWRNAAPAEGSVAHFSPPPDVQLPPAIAETLR